MIEPWVWGGFALLRPAWLLAAIPVALAIWMLARRSASATGPWERVVDRTLQPRMLVAATPGPRFPGPGLALCAAVIALAGPARLVEGPDIAYRNLAARVLVVDLSPEMDDADGGPPPSERVRLKLLELLGTLPAGQTALVAYGAEPFVVTPLTTDAATVALLVPELAPAVMPAPGNRPEAALRMAIDLLRQAGGPSAAGDIVWVTGLPDLAMTSVQALGTPGRIRISVLHAAAGDAPGLRKLAAATGGVLVTLRSTSEDVQTLTARLAASQDWASRHASHTGGIEDMGPWLACLLLPLALLSLGVRRGFAGGGLALALALVGGALSSGDGLAATDPPPGPSASARSGRDDREGYRLFLSGRMQDAALRFADPRWRAVAFYRSGRFTEASAGLAGLTDADAHYNRGNALARGGQLAAALDAFEAALALRPDDADARFNRDLVRDLLQPPKSESGSGRAPPRPDGQAPKAPADTRPPPTGEREREATALAESLLRKSPDEPAGLLRRKLLIEHERRRASAAGPAGGSQR